MTCEQSLENSFVYRCTLKHKSRKDPDAAVPPVLDLKSFVFSVFVRVLVKMVVVGLWMVGVSVTHQCFSVCVAASDNQLNATTQLLMTRCAH